MIIIMSKYIPKVGEAFEWLMSGSWNVSGKVVLVTPLEIVWLDNFGLTQFITISKSIMRPIQTKTDVEHVQLNGFFNEASNFGQSDEWLINKIQKTGFTIPKKVKRSELKKIINHHHGDSAVSYTKTVDILICELLGDLVEQDEKVVHCE
jgi:hypothetical protein